MQQGGQCPCSQAGGKRFNPVRNTLRLGARGVRFVGRKGTNSVRFVGKKGLNSVKYVGKKGLNSVKYVGKKGLNSVKYVGKKGYKTARNTVRGVLRIPSFGMKMASSVFKMGRNTMKRVTH